MAKERRIKAVKSAESPRGRGGRLASARRRLAGRRAAGRARLAAARLGACGRGAVPRRLLVRRLALRAARAARRRRRPVRARRSSPRWRRSRGCAGRRRAMSRPGSTATREPPIVPRPRSPTTSPMTSDPVAQRALGGASGAARARGRGDPGRAARPAHGRARSLRAALRRGAAGLRRRGRRPGPSSYDRFASAFDWRGGERLRRGGGKPHRRLDRPAALRGPARRRSSTSRAADPQKLTVFEDSTLVVRGTPAWSRRASRARSRRSSEKAAPPNGRLAERRWTIHGDGKATILRGERRPPSSPSRSRRPGRRRSS